RVRTDVRPETLASLLLALELWILETRRRSADAAAGPRGALGPDRAWWIVPIAWVWANAHISYYLGLVVLGIYIADAYVVRGRRATGAPAARARADRALAPAGSARLWAVAIAAASV